ncbi:MAG: efflux RND transporter periplasmic adaptor subunit [Verrucomicrobiales bacterium]|nr:efflux RND transporter periplasmic adaptor subunit [Verrucomicrobiales bacterium]
MKNIVIYIVVLALGLAAGAFFFGGGKGEDGAGKSGHDHGAEGESTKWTCSMHPQIQQPKPGKCPICGMDLIPLKKSSKKSLRPRELVMSPEARELARINTVEVKRQLVDAKIDMVGKVDYDETRTKTIAAWFPARIDKLYVDYTGIDVRKGDHLAYVYSPELLTAQRELISAIKFKSADIDTVKDKLRLWGLSEEKIRTIEVKGETDDHLDIDAPFGGIVIHKAIDEGDYVKTGGELFKIADLSQVWVQLDAYESDLPWLRYGQKVEFEVEAVPGRIFEGVVTFISPILDPKTRTVKVRVNADNKDLVLKPDMFVHASAFATLAGGGKVVSQDLAGKWIGPMHPEILRDKPGKCPICGMALAKAGELGYSVMKKAEKPPLVVPTSAVLKTGKRSVVYVEVPGKDEPTYEGREILVGPRAGGFYIVEEGLMEGERVVTEGAFKIDSALQILAKPSMMSPDGGGGGGGHDHGGKKKASGGKSGMKMTVYEVSDTFKKQLAAVFAEFFKMQSALADDNAKQAQGGGAGMVKALAAVDMKLLENDAHMAWMNDLTSIKDGAGKIAAEPSLVAQRKIFVGLSKAMANAGMSYAISFDDPAVVLNCSMAFDGKGADWLQLGDQVRNPYYGKAMLGCGEVKMKMVAPKKDAGHEDHGKMKVFEADEAFKKQLSSVYADYFGIQKSLASDDFAAVRKQAKALLSSLEKVDMKLVKGDAHVAWMSQMGEVQKTADALRKSDKIDTARAAFLPLSETLIHVADNFAIKFEQVVVHVHCSMAFDGKGGHWLQQGREVRNPYYGQAMVTCGDVMKDLSQK